MDEKFGLDILALYTGNMEIQLQNAPSDDGLTAFKLGLEDRCSGSVRQHVRGDRSINRERLENPIRLFD